jgi:hypothetical protein
MLQSEGNFGAKLTSLIGWYVLVIGYIVRSENPNHWITLTLVAVLRFEQSSKYVLRNMA